MAPNATSYFQLTVQWKEMKPFTQVSRNPSQMTSLRPHILLAWITYILYVISQDYLNYTFY